MNEYTMFFIRTDPDIDLDAHGDDAHGYEACKLLAPIPLRSIDPEAVKAEAAAHW
jgi:hypothetical protein